MKDETCNCLYKLATIFDKDKVQEKQELVNELSKVGNRAIHELAARRGWQEGSEEKILAHSIFGGLLSSLAGGKIATGTLAGGVGEYVNGRILAAKGKAWVEKHPDLVQAISAAVGSAVGAVTGESSIGSNVSLGGTKWNAFGDGHPGKKMTSVAIGVEHGKIGHVSLIIGFEDGTYEEGNLGRYGGDGGRISFVDLPSPIGPGTYTFDYNYYLGKDNKTVYFLNLDANDVAYWYNNVNIQEGGYRKFEMEGGIIIGIDNKNNLIYSGDSYRNGSFEDYNLWSNNCTTTTVSALYGPSGKDNFLLNALANEFYPAYVNQLLKVFGYSSGLVYKVYNG